MIIANKKDLLLYEIAGCPWSRFLIGKWLRRIGGAYFARKVNRKYAAYTKSKAHQLKLAVRRQS